jgi:hypothetical protein
MSIPNHPKLADLVHMPTGAVVGLPAESLALLQDEAEKALRFAKTTKDWIDGALALKYADTATATRQAAGKETGIVRFQDGTVTIIAELPKKVEWDQAALADLVERIRVEGDDPTEYVDVSFKVSERKYGAWPAHIRSAFQAARTVRVGKPTFKLSLNDEVTP